MGISGSGDGIGTAARFWSPTAIAHYGGDLFVTTANHLIRRVTPAGVVTTLAGAPWQNGSQNGAGAAARFDAPTGLAFEYTGRLFVSDTNNNAVRASALPFILNGAASRKTHDTAGTFSIQLARSGTPTIEPRRGGANGDHTLVFNFNRQVASGSATVTSGTGAVAGTPTASGNDLIVNLTGVTDAQTVNVRLDNVADSAGQALPETTISVSFLLGDTNGSGAVNAGDALQTRSRAGQTVWTDTFSSDVNTDGLINSGDATIVRSRSGSSVSGSAPPDPTIK